MQKYFSGKFQRVRNQTFFIALSFVLTYCSQKPEPVVSADLIVKNARIITMSDHQSEASALAVKADYFLKVGSNQEIFSLQGKDTKVIDAGGRAVLPGFIDAHMHPGPVFPTAHRVGVVDLRPNEVKTMSDLIKALRNKADITPKGQWVRGARYQDTKLGRHPTRKELDEASSDHPIIISHSSGHVSVVNSYALDMAKVNEKTPDPKGGGFGRYPDNTPNGICYEGAGHIVMQAGPELPKATIKEDIEGITRCFNNFLSKGITSIVDAAASPKKVQLYQQARETGTKVRIALLMRDHYLPELADVNIRSAFGDNFLRFSGIKVFHGNSLSGRTCWLSEPYDKINPETGKKDYYGIPPARKQDELDSLIFAIHKAGLQPAVHSNGDREIDMVLTAFERALKKLPKKDHRFRIEHCSVVNPLLLERIKSLGVVLALHSYVYEHGDKMVEYGKERWNSIHVNKTATDMGIPVAGNSDYGVSAADPMLRIQSMVTRKSAEGNIYGEQQKVPVMTALKIWTMGSAYATFEEDIKGSIEEGKLADFIILSKDPTKVNSDSIKNIEVLKTFVGGTLAFDAEKRN